jgi:CubicO group peptidase (beta-lactamase class C family)
MPIKPRHPAARLAVLVSVLTLSSPFVPLNAAHAFQDVPAASASAAPSKSTEERLAALEKEIEKRRVALGIPGVALVIVQGDKVIYLKGLGLRDVAGKKPVTPDTLFAIGSSTKAFTAASVLMSRDDGKLSLDDSPKKVLPYFKLQDPEADARITIRDLMCHGSGLPRTDLAWVSGVLSREEGIRLLTDVKPTAPFRKTFQYQNLMFAAAGEIASRVQKMPYESVIEKRLLQPLGMTSSNLRVSTMLKTKDFSLGYAPDPVKPGSQVLPTRNIDAIGPAGAINSSARDMAQWLRFLLARGVAPGGKRLLTEDSFSEMVKPQMVVAPKVMDYGLGWFVRKWRGLTVIEHGGNIDGFNAEVAFLPEKNLGFVLLTNVTNSALAQGALDIVWSNLVDVPADPSAPAAVADSGPTVAPKDEAGTYLLNGARITVAFAENTLTLTVPGQPPYPLERLSGRRYSSRLPLPTASLSRFAGERQAHGIRSVLEQPNGTFTLTKDAASGPGAPPRPLLPRRSRWIELLAKMVAAAGGEDSLRRHKTFASTSRAVWRTRGLSRISNGRAVPESPGAESHARRPRKKVVGTTRDSFDGLSGRFESNFTPGSEYSGGSLYDAIVQSSLQPLLDARKIFPRLEITEKRPLAGKTFSF